MQRVQIGVISAMLAIALVLVYSSHAAMAVVSTEAADLDQIRGIGSGLGLYQKKYSFFPAMVDMSAATTTSLKIPRSKGNCLALKLLLDGSFIEDVKVFFSPRSTPPDATTLNAMQKDFSPVRDATWACSYAYDAGHTSAQTATAIFGTPPAWLAKNAEGAAHVLTADGVTHELARDKESKKFALKNHKVGNDTVVEDDIYADQAEALAWADACLVLDVPMVLTKAAGAPEAPAPAPK